MRWRSAVGLVERLKAVLARPVGGQGQGQMPSSGGENLEVLFEELSLRGDRKSQGFAGHFALSMASKPVVRHS